MENAATEKLAALKTAETAAMTEMEAAARAAAAERAAKEKAAAEKAAAERVAAERFAARTVTARPVAYIHEPMFLLAWSMCILSVTAARPADVGLMISDAARRLIIIMRERLRRAQFNYLLYVYVERLSGRVV